MTKYREIIRLASLNLSQTNIALSCGVSKKTVNKVLKAAREKGISWPLNSNQTDAAIEQLLFQKKRSPAPQSNRRMPDYAHIRKELLRNGVNKKLLWTEYLEECRLSGDEPLMYSPFCYYIQQDEQKHRATMHINRKPAEQVEVDWAGDSAHIIDQDTGEILDAYIFVGVMTYSQYPYVEAFMDEKQPSWIAAHVHMYEYFDGVAKILVPDNCRTAVDHNKVEKTSGSMQSIRKWQNTMALRLFQPAFGPLAIKQILKAAWRTFPPGSQQPCVMNSSSPSVS